MKGGFRQNGNVPTYFDKSRVLDVKPLRSLIAVFPQTPVVTPPVCSSPSGAYPPGFSPFYPFNAPKASNEQQQAPPGPMPTPIRSYRAPQYAEQSNGDMGITTTEGDLVSPKQSVSRSLKRKTKLRDSMSVLMSELVVELDPSQRDDGNNETVNYVLIMFDALRRRLSQLEDAKEGSCTISGHANLKAGNILMTNKCRTNMKKRIGHVPGVEVGDIFFFRFEMCLVGLHAQSMSGIDYMNVRLDVKEEPLAVSIVSAGGYDDNAEDTDVLVYSGQGGTATKDKAASDQKLERGNLALERSSQRGNEVRVIRGMKDVKNPSRKIYVYDGLYRIQQSWTEKGKTGGNIFKHKFVRLTGQPSAFAIWKSIEKWKESTSSRVGFILPDLTSGAEKLPVSLVNDVDDEKQPAYFTYISSLKNSKSFSLTQPSSSCSCNKACAPDNLNCTCIQKNGGSLPYTADGILVSRRQLLYECGPTCPCYQKCKNRVTQTGLNFRLEVFKTKDRGWGLRSWDPIRAGSFICEYAGEVIDRDKAKQKAEGESDMYIFDAATLRDNSIKWNYEPGLLEEDVPAETNMDYHIPDPPIVSAKNVGNVARFINHSCYPTLFWQPVIYEQNGESSVHIAFFAIKHIPPMTELTYDYGIAQSDESEAQSSDIPPGKKCLCGSEKCRGYFG